MKARLIRQTELVLTVFIIVIFSLSAYQCGTFAFRHMETGGDFDFVLSSIISMAISGLGLILLLMAKLDKLDRAHKEKKEIMAMLFTRMAALEASMDGIGIVDKAGRLTYINKALMDLHGLEHDDLPDYLGSPWEALYSQKGQQEIREKVLPHLKDFRNWRGVAPVLRKDRTIVFAEMSLTLLDDGGLIGTARDITKRLRAEKEKEDLQKQFFQAQKMEAIGRLAGGIAHDFNNILASMLGFTGFLVDDLPEGSEQHHFASQIMTGGLLAQHLIDQILAFSRPGDITRENVDLAAVTAQTAEMLKSTLPVSVKLDTTISLEGARIKGNPTLIGQALMNLCVNGVDAMAESRGELAIKLETVNSKQDQFPERPGSPPDSAGLPASFVDVDDITVQMHCGTLVKKRPYARISVTDNGCGMTRKIMEHMFEPFFTTKPLDKGSGLGLASVHGIIAGHQGAMVVKSTQGKGTCFELYFPLAKQKHIAVTPVKALSPHTASASGRILVVEDSRDVREALVEMVKRLGHEVESCADGDLAIDRLREKPGFFDLVITDYTMPHMNGAELGQEITGDFPGLPVILISGYSDDRLHAVADKNPNIRCVLRKPVSKESMAHYIARALNERQAKS